MVNTIYLLSFVETPRKFIIAQLSELFIIAEIEIEKHSTIDQEGKPLDSTWRALFTVQN